MEVSLQHCGALNNVVVQENGNDGDKNVITLECDGLQSCKPHGFEQRLVRPFVIRASSNKILITSVLSKQKRKPSLHSVILVCFKLQ